MYEELYEELTKEERDRYLELLGMEEPAAADLDYLDRLVFAHQCTVSFENLDPMAGKMVSLATKDLYDKIVVRGRGGFCFEMNSIFCRLLKACGFDVYGCRARVVRNKDFAPQCLHRGTLVRLDGQLYYVDVGYGGPQPGGAVKVEDGFVRTVCGQTFRIDRADDVWWTLGRVKDDGHEPLIQFMLLPENEPDYLTGAYFCATNPDSIFVQKYMLNRRLENGTIALVGDLFIRSVDGVHTEEVVSSRERLIQIAEDYFLIKDAAGLIQD